MVAPHLQDHRLALLTDLYQLTMAYGFWKNRLADRRAAFHLTFRKCPFGGEYAIASGLAYAVEFFRNFSFADGDLQYLSTLRGADDKPLLEPAFLDYLQQLQFGCDIDAIAEGTAVFAHEPLVRVTGPLLQCQILETPLLNMINFQTLVATKAARVCGEAQGDPVLEFGLRRAQGVDGGVAASRAAFVGGCAATSNVLAGKLFDIPVKGTHAHSWVMAFDGELEAFQAYARALPNNGVFLVDTYDTLAGVEKAIQVARELRRRGHEIQGVRLDSGDLATLSIAARQLLDSAGFPEASIVASNDLDEFLIRDLKQQGAKINVWGVGTRLATAYDQPALGGVYKLSAIMGDDERWRYKLKLSEQAIKVSNPGVHQVRRYYDAGEFIGDVVYDAPTGCGTRAMDVRHQQQHDSPFRVFDDGGEHEDLLVPVFRGGRAVYDPPSAAASRQRTQQQLERLAPAIKRLRNPAPYFVGLEESLYEQKRRLIEQSREIQA